LREDAQKLKEEKTTLQGMIQSHDELIMEMAEEYGLNRMGENDDDEDDDDKGNAIAPSAPTPAVVPEEIIEEEALVEMVPEQEAPVAHEMILAYAETKSPQPHLFNMIMRDYEESLPWMENGPEELDYLDDLNDLDDDPNEGCSNMDEWFLEDGRLSHRV
jgi:hypothetical protein